MDEIACHDNEYLKLMQLVIDTGTWNQNRTGIRTKSIFGPQMRFDLRDGSIPLLTTKHMHIRSIVHELLWYLMGTGNIKYLQDNGVRIWNEWSSIDNHLGPVYGTLWRAFPPPNTFHPISNKTVVDDTNIRTWLTTDSSLLTLGKYSNQQFTNIQGKEYTVLGVDGKQSNGVYNNKERFSQTYTVRFNETGWCKYKVPSASVHKGKFVDQSIPSVYGVGILGDYKNKNETALHKHLRRIWENMISKCYNPKDTAFDTHGAKGVLVCERWKVLSDFIDDVHKLPNWYAMKQEFCGYILDKDYYGDNKLYHVNTSVWMLRTISNMHRQDATPTVIKTSDKILYFPTESSAAKYIGTSPAAIKARTMGKVLAPLHGASVSSFDQSGNHIIRHGLYVDQISQLINGLCTNPTSRRLMLSAWHPGMLPDDGLLPATNAERGLQALPPCHFHIQCNVVDGELSMILNQRSCDVFLGIPFNVVQYSILLRMLAEVTNLKPGELIWNGGNVHVYENHLDQCAEQLSRKPFKSPTLVFNRYINNIDDFRFDDFEIIGYNSHPTIKAVVAV